MKIFYETSMPYAQAFFSHLGECVGFEGKNVTAADVADADVLLVRSTTKVDELLLAPNSRLQFVATATAGHNHLDSTYLNKRNIAWTSAAGCNAIAVVEYVLAAIFHHAEKAGWELQSKSVGIVGAGHVGTALSERLQALGIQHLLCDPPLAEGGDQRKFVGMDEIMACDIISLHVPLVTTGEYPTGHLFDLQRLSQLSENQLLINACRGEVVDNQALLTLFQQGRQLNVVLDVWENEPDILLPLVPYTSLATAHIAGHSLEGKARGTEMLYQALCRQLGREPQHSLQDFLPEPDVKSMKVTAEGQQSIGELIRQQYDIEADSLHFKQQVVQPGQFEYIRKHYHIRREFAALEVDAGNFSNSQAIYGLGFSRPLPIK